MSRRCARCGGGAIRRRRRGGAFGRRDHDVLAVAQAGCAISDDTLAWFDAGGNDGGAAVFVRDGDAAGGSLCRRR